MNKAAVAALAGMAQLRSLKLERISTEEPKDYSFLAGMTELEEVGLGLNKMAFMVQDPHEFLCAEIAKLKKLKSVRLDMVPYSDDLKLLASLPDLIELHFDGPLKDEDLEAFQTFMQQRKLPPCAPLGSSATACCKRRALTAQDRWRNWSCGDWTLPKPTS